MYMLYIAVHSYKYDYQLYTYAYLHLQNLLERLLCNKFPLQFHASLPPNFPQTETETEKKITKRRVHLEISRAKGAISRHLIRLIRLDGLVEPVGVMIVVGATKNYYTLED